MLTRLTLALALLVAAPSWSGPVRLTNDDGSLVFEGQLLSRKGELFRIGTEFGPVTVDAGGLACSGSGCPDPSELIVRASVGGPSDLVHRLFPALIEAFADSRGLVPSRVFHDDAHVSWEVRDVATDRLVAVFDVGSEESVDATRRLEDGVLTLAFGRAEADSSVLQDVVALDALVPAVAPDNPRVMLTLSQLRELLSGASTTWEKLAEVEAPVSLHVANDFFFEVSRLGLDRLSNNAKRHDDLSVLADTVASDPAALGLLPYSGLGNATPLVISGACGLATPATRDTIRAEDYPLTQPVYLQRRSADQPRLLRDYVAFARSEAAQPVIRAAGFVDQAIGRISFERQGGRIANAVLAADDDPARVSDVRNMIATLLGGERLTLSFRFRDGSSELDPQSTSNIQRLANAVSSGAFEGFRMMFVGFSDGVGEPEANLRLSESRARSVRRAVAARVAGTPMEMEVAAFGELMPMACDDTPWGGAVNRRVEVWIKPS